MPAIKTARTVWLVRAGRKDKPENQEHFALKHNLALITYQQESDLRAYHRSDRSSNRAKNLGGDAAEVG